MTLPSFWQLENFGPRLDAWIDSQQPEDALINTVTRWVFSRYDDPYQGAEREPEFPNYWLVRVPGTLHDDSIVCCFFWVYEIERRIRCDNFATLSLPL